MLNGESMFAPEDKNMLIGAGITAGVDLALEAYFAYMQAKGTPIPNTQFPYEVLHPAIPPVNNILAEGGTPLILYLLGKGLKKEALIEMAKGGVVYGGSELIGQTVFRVAVTTVPAPPAATYKIIRR